MDDVVRRIQPLLQDEYCLQALAVLRQDFLTPDAIGPRRVAHFLTGGPDDALQAEGVGFVDSFLSKLGK